MKDLEGDAIQLEQTAAGLDHDSVCSCVGNATEDWAARHPDNAAFGAKRLIGGRITGAIVQVVMRAIAKW